MCRGSGLLSSVLGAALLLGSVPVAASSFGLVVGIDQYEALPSLDGAANDARDIASALQGSGFDEVVLLLDGEASRGAILDAWGQIVAKAKPGDTVVFAYAGHGGQERERVTGDETDGLNEVFLLPSFEVKPPGNADRLLDDDLYDLFRAASGLRIVFVADSCHSGTMTRSFDIRAGAGKSRLSNYGKIIDDTLPSLPTRSAGAEDDLEHVVFFGAVEDDQVVVEVSIEGKPRGAMSWAFARAMRGAADRDGNRRLDTGELDVYLRETVRTVTEGRQLPRMLPRGRPVRDVVSIEGGGAVATTGSVRVFGLAEGDPFPEGAVRANSPSEADLIWDPAKGEVVSAAGDVVASLGSAGLELVPRIIDKWRILGAARTMAEREPLTVSLSPGHGRHRAGDEVEITFADPRYANLVLVNLANDGTVQLLAPGPDPNDVRYNGSIGAGQPFKLPVKVVPPFGTDHVLAFVSAEPAHRMIDFLRQQDSRPADAAFAEMLAEIVSGSIIQTAIASIVTGP